MNRVTNSFGRESAGVSVVFVVPAFRRVIAETELQSSEPEALIAQEPFDVGRTWASLLRPLSKINKQNAVTYRMGLPLGTSSAKKVYTLVWNVSFLAYCTMNSSKEGTTGENRRSH
jgi:hypothetical protein